jgi:hypothetical protein
MTLPRLFAVIASAVLLVGAELHAHPIIFNSTIACSSSQPSGGAAFDAANIGGSGTNANGSPNN